MKWLWLSILIGLLAAALVFPLLYFDFITQKEETEVDLYFGVSFGLKTADEAKLLIDKVKGFTNFFLVNSWDLSTNETALNEVCDYAVEAGLSFIVFFDYISLSPEPVPDPFHANLWQADWVVNAKERWGDKYVGVYIYEEPGGKQIDTGQFDEGRHIASLFQNVSTYSEAADVFVTELPQGWSFHFLQNSNISRFTSDYALYWFDYLADYSTIFVELGWNHSTPQHIGLCRGAATNQGKDWGAHITWTSYNPPYMASGPEILEEMLAAYETGAKYVVVFNFPFDPDTNPFGILRDDHFEAMRQFWDHIHQYPKDHGKIRSEAVFVLPKDYGWGMRRPDDLIWGLWPSDDLSPVIWEKMNKLVEKYGLQLDIVYDDDNFVFERYSEVYYWNSTID